MTKPVRIGIIGAGRIGQVHAENLAYRVPGVDVKVIADVNIAAARQVAEKYKIPSSTDQHTALLNNPDIDAVLICSSTDTHAQFIEDAAAAGKHIFCEKPISHDLAKIDKALEAVKKAGVKLQIGFNRRFDPNFKAVHDMIAAGQVGELHLLRITSRDPAPPPIEYIKVSGGIFLDMTIHDFDMARFIAGSEVTEIYAAGAVLVDPKIGEAGDIDTAVITLKFANGVIGNIENSRKAIFGYDQRLEVLGTGGGITVTNNMPHTAVLSNAEGVHAAKPLYFFLERYTEAFTAEMKAFVAAVQENKPTPVTGNDGLMAAVIGLAAQKSFKENRPVKLSEIR